MPDTLRNITGENISHAIRILNESSRGMSFEWQFDLFSFLMLWQYWNFSPEYSLIHYVEDEPAAIALNSANPETRDAYNFYWGALPEFRSPKISIGLFNAFCQKLYAAGYTMLHGDAAPERPVRRYRFIQAQPHLRLLEMQCAAPSLPEPSGNYQLRALAPTELEPLLPVPDEPLHWCQRLSFLKTAAQFVQIVGAFAANKLEAYVVVLTQASHTTLSDLRSPTHNLAAGNDLLHTILNHNYRPPLKVTHILDNGYAHQLLAASGFTVIKSYTTLTRDLRATCSDCTPS